MKRDDIERLAAFKQQLAERDRAAAELLAAQAARAARAAAQRNAFARSVGPITPLAADGRVQQAAATALPLPRQRERDEAAALRSSLSDEFDVASLLETDAALGYRRAGVGPDVLPRLRSGHWAIQAELDLHGLRRDAARDQLSAFIHRCARAGLRCVRIVHGKGNGSPGREPVLKHKVKIWLAQKKEVIAFTQARAADGGHGAVLVMLEPQKLRAARGGLGRDPPRE